MHKQIYQKFFFHTCLFMLVVSLLAGFYDVIFGSIWEFCHLLFEVVEMTLDEMIEHLFDTDLHDTQMIVFYILLVIGGTVAYLVWKLVKLLVGLLGHEVTADWQQFKLAASSDWRSLTMMEKTLGIALFLLLNYFISFLFF